MMKYYYTYVLKSHKDNNFYVGWSKDIFERVEEHNEGLVGATKGRVPLELVYYEACLNETDAIRREKQLKTGFGRSYLKRRLSGTS
jgi:putative endonuclease